MLKAGGWVRPVEFAVDFELTVSRPGDARIDDALRYLASDDKQLFRIRLVEPGEPADVALAVASEADLLGKMEGSGIAATIDEATLNEIRASAGSEPRLWFLPGSGEASLVPGRRAPSLRLGAVLAGDSRAANAKFDAELAGYLTKIYRATNIARMAAASDFRGKVDITFLVLNAETGDFQPIAAGTIPPISDGDEIHVRVANHSSAAVDLNVLYVGTDYSISAAPPERIERNGTDEIGLFGVDTKTLGQERLIAIVTEALPGADRADLRFLAQGGLRSASDEAEKGFGEAGGLVGMLYGMGKQAATRGATPLGEAKGAKGAVWIYPVEAVKRD
jgi:hypothetical protein